METPKQPQHLSDSELETPEKLGKCLLTDVADMIEHGYSSATVSQHEIKDRVYRNHFGETFNLICSTCGAGCNISHNDTDIKIELSVNHVPSLSTCPRTETSEKETPETNQPQH